MSRRKHSARAYARRITAEVRTHPANRRHPRRALARTVTWQVLKRTWRRPVDVELNGLVIRCHPDSQSASNLWYFTPRYDHDDMLFVERYLRPGDDVADVGANIGTYTLLVASLTAPDGRVEAFEPDVVNVSRLRENVTLNHLGDRVTVHEAAVSDEDGEVTFLTGSDVANAIQRPGDRPGATRQVRSVRLDDAVGDGTSLALVKIDVEGAEVHALRGAHALLEAAPPPVLLIEVLVHQLEKFGSSWEELRDILGEHGYQPWTYDARRDEMVPVADAPRGNCLFVQGSALAEVRALVTARVAEVPEAPVRLRVVRRRR